MTSVRPLEFTKSLRNDVYPAIDPKTTLKGSLQKGKIAVVTGASRGIGKAIASALAHAGVSTLVLTARTTSQLDEVEVEVKKVDGGINVIKHSTDVSNRASVEALFDKLTSEGIGKIDILINNAGYLEEARTVAKQDIDEVETVLDVNIKGTTTPTMLFLRHNIAACGNDEAKAMKEVTVICTSSVGALIVSPRLGAYQPSKTYINRFVEFLDVEHGQQGLRAFAYHPGGVRTALGTRTPKEMHGFLIDTPELAAGYVVWLLSPQADFLRGRYSSSNWDVEEMLAKKDVVVAKDLLKQKVWMGELGP